MIIPQKLLLSLLPSSLFEILPLSIQEQSPSVLDSILSGSSLVHPPVELEPLVSVSLPIAGFYNNKGTSETGEQVNGEGFDGAGATFPSEFLPTGLWVDEGVEVSFDESRKTSQRSSLLTFLSTPSPSSLVRLARRLVSSYG